MDARSSSPSSETQGSTCTSLTLRSSAGGSSSSTQTVTMTGTPDMSESRYPVDVEKGDSQIAERPYAGMGTADDPYVVDWDLNDPEDPYNWPKPKRWAITAQVRAQFLWLYSHRAYFSSCAACLVHVYGVVQQQRLHGGDAIYDGGLCHLR